MSSMSSVSEVCPAGVIVCDTEGSKALSKVYEPTEERFDNCECYSKQLEPQLEATVALVYEYEQLHP
jgi:hypothetical protein